MLNNKSLNLKQLRNFLGLLLALLLLTLAMGTTTFAQTENTSVELRDVQGRLVGDAHFTQTELGVEIEINVSGMDPVAGQHGVHIHRIGLCGPPDFKSSGAHYNPTESRHGMNALDGPHAGDLPNMDFTVAGNGSYKAVTERFELSDLYDEDGSSLIITARPDNHSTQPDGNSGERIICGIIAPFNAEITDESEQEEEAVDIGEAELGTLLIDSQGRLIGSAILSQGGNLVGVAIVLEGLDPVPGDHRVAVTSTAKCETPDFTSAGEEIGVLPSLQLFDSGTANYQAVADGFTVDSLIDEDGSTLVIYADTGDNPGERIACGSLIPLDELIESLGVPSLIEETN